MAIIESRKQEAVNGMSACIARMVSEKELLISSSSGSRSFKLMEVMDGGGFATLVKGQLDVDVPRMSKVAAAKIAVDMETDKEGNLTTQQRQSYQASMRHEHQIYERLAGSQNGIPAVYFAGCVKKAGDPQHPNKLHFLSFMVLELLGPSVGYLSLELQTYSTNLKLLVNHGLGMLKVLRFMHENGIVHRDVKPDNFCLPYGFDPLKPTSVDTVYIVDMGMAQQFSRQGFDWDAKDSLYMGTVDYSSVRALHGYNSCGWDDLESLAITLLEMATGNVPFDLVQRDDPLTAERLQEMAVQKEKQWQQILTSAETPGFIKQWMRHLRSVPPKQHPRAADYTALEDCLKSALVPASAAASSAWSSDVSVLQLQSATFPQTVAAVSSRKRHAPTMSAASNMVSCMSEAATVMQSKRMKCLQQYEDDGTSMANSLVGFSQGILLNSQAEE